MSGTNIALATGAWTHLAVTRSGNTVTLYVNGAVAGSGTITINPSALGVTTQNYLGRSQFSADPYLNAALDDFRIYSRALSASEISVFQTPLALPQNLAATAGPKQVALTWSAVPNASSYLVKSATTSARPYTLIGTVTSAAFTHSGLPQTPRYYVVTAQNLAGSSPDSAEVGATPESAAFTVAEMRGASLTHTGNGRTLTMTLKSSVAGHDYQLQFTDDLVSGDWDDVGNSQTGNGNDLTFNIPPSADATRGYFRFVIQR